VFLATLICATAFFLATATYSRKETVRGVLRPVGGEVRITASGRGIVRQLFVSEGTVVATGAPLAVISTARSLESGAVADDQALASLAREEEALRARLAAHEASAPYDRAVIAAQMTGLSAELGAARTAVATSAERLRIAEERLELGRRLEARGFISGDEMRRRQEAVLIQQQARADAHARELALRARIAELRARRAQQPHMAANERGALAAPLAALIERRTEFEARRGYSLHAPIAGRVTALQAAVGRGVEPQGSLMTITPPHARLQAELYAPSRAIGFIRRGQRVRLLYESFPYQAFGPAFGVVEAISDSALRPSDLQVAIPVDEPVYRIVVRLERSTIDAFGRAMPLRAGAALKADIILEERSFAAWLFEPALAMRGRL
jgi:membrane fusion protein